MPVRGLLYYITDRTAFGTDESTRRCRLLEKIAEAVRAGVDYIQIREKDLSTREVESLAQEAVTLLNQLPTDHQPRTTALLINSRTDIALATGSGGVHLRSNDITPNEVRTIWTKCGAGTPFDKLRAGSARERSPQKPLIAVSCHTPAEVAKAAAQEAAVAVFAPVFEKLFGKKDSVGKPLQPTGLAALRQACTANIPVLALGGVTVSNAHACLEAGAAGIAGIRLFQENNIEEIVRALRAKRNDS